MEIIYQHFESVTSTNDWAKAHVDSFPLKALTVVTAETQTQGRGRFGRRWASPTGENLYITFSFFASAADPVEITHLLALTASQLLEEKGVNTQIKWPNDLLVKRKKIAGILCETVQDQWIIIGMGLNVNMPTESLAQIDQPATSLLCETGVLHAIDPLITQLSQQFAANLELYLEKGFAPFSQAFHKRI